MTHNEQVIFDAHGPEEVGVQRAQEGWVRGAATHGTAHTIARVREFLQFDVADTPYYRGYRAEVARLIELWEPRLAEEEARKTVALDAVRIIRDALEFYGPEAGVLGSNQEQAMPAAIHVLALDGGARAGKALDALAALATLPPRGDA